MELFVILFFKINMFANNIQETTCPLECSYEIDTVENNLFVQITNNTSDTLFLFDSYITDYKYNNHKLITSEYLYRYNRQRNIDIISFIPLLPYLSPYYFGDVIYIGNNRIIHQGQVIWHFLSIPPGCNITLTLPSDILSYSHTYYDISNKQNSSFSHRLKFKKIKTSHQSNKKMIEFAVYKNINLLSDTEAYYNDEHEYNAQGKNYFKLELFIDN